MLCLYIIINMDSFKFISKYIRKYKWLYIAGIATLFVVDFSSLFIPKLTGIITDGLSSKTFTLSDVVRSLIQILVLAFIMALGRIGWRFFFMGTARSLEKDVRNDMFSHLTLMSSNYYQNIGSGDLMSRFTSDLNCVRTAIGPAVISLFDGTVMTVMVLLQMIFYVDLKLTIITMIPMVLIAIGVLIYGKLMHKLYDERQAAISSLTDYSRESFTGIRVVMSFVREKNRMYRFAKENINTREKTLKANYMMAVFMPALDLIIELSILITLIYGGYLTMNGVISIGKFIAYNQYIIMLIWPMIACGDAVNSFSQGAASISRIKEIIDAKPEIIDKEGIVERPLNEAKVSFNNLNFVYPNRIDAGVFNINFEVPSGKCVAITGKTGSGKTTLVELLLHVYEINNGSIFIDNIDINDIPIHQLRDFISYVPQDNFLFSDTIYNNIIFGSTKAEYEDVINASKAACIHDNILEFTNGYETLVGERGVTLSGGQKQRVCIARAILKNAPILILDDALSAVDTDTERILLKNIMNLRKDKTTIIIAHRITTISSADIIVVLEDGKIKEKGTHEELLDNDGIYKQMFMRQSLEEEYKDFLG